VTVSVTYFVRFEVRNPVQTLSRFRPIAASRPWAAITVLRMKTVVYMAMKTLRTVKPWAGTNENAARKPFRTIVSIRRALIRRRIVVPIRTHRRNSHFDADLSVCSRGSSCEANSSNRR
jgi:hypothetical protein